MSRIKQRELIKKVLKNSGYVKLERNVYHHSKSNFKDSLYVDNFGFNGIFFKKLNLILKHHYL